jgi:hypothetical protein
MLRWCLGAKEASAFVDKDPSDAFSRAADILHIHTSFCA